MRLLVTVLVLFAISSLVSGQFGAGSAIYIPDKPKGSGIAYLYPFTGLAEAGSKEFTIDLWYWAEKWTSEWKGTPLSIATVDDDNWIRLEFAGLLYFKSDEGRFNFNITEPARTWQHYAISVNLNTLLMDVYVNGKLVGSPKIGIHTIDLSDPIAIVLGNDQDTILGGFSPSSHTPGLYDNLRIWSKAHTIDEVVHHMSRDVNAATPNLIAAWDFDDGSGYEIREVKTGRPEWSMSIGSSYATAADLQNKQFSKFENDIQVTWGPSHARCRGSGMTSGFSRGVRKVFHLRDITEFSEITMTSLSPLCKLEDASSRQSLITNSIISSSFAFIAPADGTENEYSLSYTAGGEAATIVFKLAQPITPTNFTMTFIEDAPLIENVIKFGGAYENPQTWRVRIYISRLPHKGRIQNQLGFPDKNEEYAPATNITEPMFVTGGYNQILYQAGVDEFGNRYTTLEYKVVDESRWDDLEAIQQLPSGIVTISITPGNDAPKLLSSTVTGTDPLNPKNVSQDEVTILQYDVFDSDGDDVLMEIISLPSHGDLWLSDKFGNRLHKLTTTAVGTQEVEQYAAKLLNFSSEFVDKSGSWAVTQVLGKPIDLKIFGDSIFAWSPASVDGFGCKDVGGGGDVFHTEFLHLKFNESVYVKELFSYENVGAGALVGVRAKDPTTNTWKRLYLGASDVPIRENEYIVFKPAGMCGTWFHTDELYLEFDTCNRPGWNEVDAVLMVGTTDTNLGAVPPNSSIVYVPHNGFVGEDSFEFVLTDCPGDRFRKSDAQKSFLKVSEAPSSRVQTLQSSEGSNEVLTLQGGPTWEITGSPKWGTIQINGLDSRQYDQISAGSIVRYRPDDVECKKSASAYKDSFVITTSITRDSSSSQSEFIIYEIVGCSLSSAFPYWIFIVVGAVIVVACVAIFWFSTRQHRRMAALYNNNRVAEECAEAIAFMHLEEVSYLVTLPNPNKIQKAFLKIIQTLEEYRNFLPSSMFAGDTESVSESCTEMTSEIGHGDSSFYSNTGLPPRRVRSGSASTASSKGTSTAMRSRLAHLQVSVLRKKQISMLCSNINGFKRIREDEIVQAHHDYLTAIVKAARDTRGVPEPFLGDRVMISWNAALAIPNYRESSCTCAIAISDGIKNMQSETNLKVSLGVASSGALVGNLGIAGMKKFAIIGGAYPAAVVLMRLNSKFSTEILAEGSYRVEALKFQMFPVSRVVYEKFSERPFVVFNVLSTRIEKNEEWMYSMQDGIHPVLDQLDAILMGKESANNFSLSSNPNCCDVLPIQTEAFMSKLAANPDYIDEISSRVHYI